MKIILDPHWRKMDELFSAASLERLKKHDVVWGRDDAMPDNAFTDALPSAEVLVAATPQVSAETLTNAPKLRAVIEVSGSFPETIDYTACAERGVEVLSCAPGFRAAVAEMALAMILGAGRGLVREHEAFRSGNESWLEDCEATDFTLFNARVGFVGFGQIAQETARLLAPFSPQIRAFDPWLAKSVADDFCVELVELSDLASWAQVLIVAAVPTSDNEGLIDANILSKMQKGALLLILSRAHLVEFDAVTAAAEAGQITVAVDVFPHEPLAQDHPIRSFPNVILSPHRAAAVKGGRHLIGEMICDDLDSISSGDPDRRLLRADAERIAQLAGIGDAASVADMATKRS